MSEIALAAVALIALASPAFAADADHHLFCPFPDHSRALVVDVDDFVGKLQVYKGNGMGEPVIANVLASIDAEDAFHWHRHILFLRDTSHIDYIIDLVASSDEQAMRNYNPDKDFGQAPKQSIKMLDYDGSVHWLACQPA